MKQQINCYSMNLQNKIKKNWKWQKKNTYMNNNTHTLALGDVKGQTNLQTII